MPYAEPTQPKLTRRALGAGLAAGAAALGIGRGVGASVPVMDPDLRDAAPPDLSLLHDAIRACRPVGFGYTVLSGTVTEQKVLPLVLVHPAQGVKLLA